MIRGRQVLDDQAVGTTGDSFSREPMYRGVLEKEFAEEYVMGILRLAEVGP